MDTGRADYRGYPSDVNVEYTEEKFDYDQVKTNLIFARVQDVTRDRVSFRETLRTL
jgi:hypothetical protein